MQTVMAAVNSAPTPTLAEYTCDLAAVSESRALGAYVVDTRLVSALVWQVLGDAIGTEAEFGTQEGALALLDRQGADSLNAFRLVCARKGVDCEELLAHGRPAAVLESLAPLYRMSVVGSPLYGATAEFLRLSSRPFVVVRHDYRRIERVVVGYDGGEAATRALEAVLPMARVGGWRVTVGVAGERRGKDLEMAMRAEEFPHFAEVGEGVEIRPGVAAEVLLEMIKEQQADLVVVGSRETKGLARLLLGSTSRRLVREAPVPVMVFR